MTEQNPPIFLQAGSHPAEDVRRMFTALGSQEGIVMPDDLEVTENGTPNMSVDVAAGAAFIDGTEETFQGRYFVENRATVNLTISAADATNDRIDRIVAQVEDSEYSGATDAWSLAVVTGTPAGSPTAPTIPENSLLLADVTVAATVTSITDSDIDDQRVRSSSLTGEIPCTNATRPSSPIEGLRIYETDTGRSYRYVSGSWLQIGGPREWTSLSLTSPWTAQSTGTYGVPAISVVDGEVRVRGMVENGDKGANSVIDNVAAAFRPTYVQFFPIYSADGAGRLDVLPSGNIELGATSSASAISNVHLGVISYSLTS